MKNKKSVYAASIVTAIVVVSASIFLFVPFSPRIAVGEPEVEAPAPIVSVEEEFPYIIEPRSTLFSTLRELSVPPQTIQHIVKAAKPIQNLARLRPGIRFQVVREPAQVEDISAIQFRFSAIERLDVRKVDGMWTADKITEQVDLREVTFSGTVTSSLWESAQRAQMDPNLISELADIFGWVVDFAREVRAKDRWRLVVEQKTVRGEPIGWGAILAAEYINAGETHRAVLFRSNGQEIGYFTPEGQSLRKMFLKSPIRYGRITSGFSLRRFHPILRENRPHRGVDYAAPIGTPIRAVGDGVVLSAGWSGGGGNVIRLRHNSTYQTAYMHLKGFAAGVRKGARVQQGQVIGYVGNTGMSTGPHLHFEFYQAGRYVDPLGRKFPSADPVPSNQMVQFQETSTMVLAKLPTWPAVEMTADKGEHEGLGPRTQF